MSFTRYNNELNLFVSLCAIQLDSVKSAADVSPELVKHVSKCPICFVVAVQQKKTLLESGCHKYLELIALEVSRWPSPPPES